MAEDQTQLSSEKPQAGRSMHPLDQRLLRVAQMLSLTRQQVERLTQAVGELASRQQHIDQLGATLTGRLSELHGQIGSSADDLRQRLAGALSQLEGQRRVAEAAQERANDLLEAATSAGERLAGVQDDLGARITGLEESLGRAIDGIEATGEEARRTSSRLDDQVFALKGRVIAFAEGVEAWFKPARAEIEAHRAIVERAAEQISSQLAGFEEVAESMRQRIDGEVADLRGRRDAGNAAIERLGAKLDACIEALARRPDGESGADGIKPQLEQLAAQVREHGVGAEDLAFHMRSVESKIEAAVARSEQRLAPALDELTARLAAGGGPRQDDAQMAALTDQLGELGRRLDAVGDQVAGRMEPILAALQERPVTAAPDGARVEQGLASLESRLGAVAEQLTCRINDALAAGEARSREAQQQAAAHRAEIADAQAKLAKGLDRLEQQVADGLVSAPGDGAAGSGEQAASIVGELNELREQLVIIRHEMLENVGSVLTAVEREAPEGGSNGEDRFLWLETELGAKLADLRDQVAMSQQASGAPGDSQQIDGIARQLAELRDGLAGLSERVDAVGGDLDGRLSEALAGAAGRASSDPQQLATLQHQINELGEQMAGISTKLDRRLQPQGEAGETSLGAAGFDSRLEQELSDLKSWLAAVPGQVQDSVSELLSGTAVRPGAEGGDGGGAKRLEALISRLEERVTSALEDLAGRPHHEHEQITGQLAAVGEQVQRRVSDALAGLETLAAHPGGDTGAHQQLSALVGRLEERVTAALADGSGGAPDSDLAGRIDRQFDGLQKQLGTLGDRLASLEGSLTDVEAKAPGAKAAAKPGGPPAAAPPQQPAGASKGAAPKVKAKGPQTPDQRVNGMIDAINSGSAETIRQFVIDNYAESALKDGGVGPRVEVYLSVFEEAGQIRLVTLDRGAEGELVALVQSKLSLERQRFEIVLQPAPPHKIMVVNIDEV